MSKTYLFRSSAGRFAAILFLAAFLWIYWIVGLPLNGDETLDLLYATGQAKAYQKTSMRREIFNIEDLKKFTLSDPNKNFRDTLWGICRTGAAAPLHYALLHHLLGATGNNPSRLKLISVFFSLLSLVFLRLVTQEADTEKSALMTALLYAICPYALYHAHLVRPYPLATLLSLSGTYLALRIEKSEVWHKKNCGCSVTPWF